MSDIKDITNPNFNKNNVGTSKKDTIFVIVIDPKEVVKYLKSLYWKCEGCSRIFSPTTPHFQHDELWYCIECGENGNI